MAIVNSKNFRDIILQAFREREKKTVGYAMGQFAQLIQVSPAKLSMILSGKTGISPTAANDMAERLGFSTDDKDYFVTLVASRHHRSGEGRNAALQRLKTKWGYLDFDELSLEDLSELSDWGHFAILHLVEIEGFQQNTAWIARRLGLQNEKVKKIVADLFSRGFLIEDQGRWVSDSKKLRISIKGKSEVLQNMHSQLIMKAHESITGHPESRHLTSSFLTLSEDKMELARTRIREFAISLVSELSDKPSENDRVCALGIQLFNLDKAFDSKP